MKLSLIIAGLLVLGATARPAAADEPLEPPVTRKLTSGNRSCWAVTDAKRKVTTAYRAAGKAKPSGDGAAGSKQTKGKDVEIWQIPGWYRVAALSRDCAYLVTGYDGVNLLPVGFDRGTVMLTFYKNGKLLREVRLAELVPDLSKLRRTVSHVEWGRYIGVEKDHYYRVDTNDRGALLFDMTTGQLAAGRHSD
jgi:hypothetical protein